jgi:hypothetical protein
VSGEVGLPTADLAGIQIPDLFGRWPIMQTYSIELFTPPDGDRVAAARYDGDSTVFVYYLEGIEDGLWNPALPFVRIIPDRTLPILSPGFVALLGYTPWEISQSDLVRTLLQGWTTPGSVITLLDKGGAGHRLVYSRTPNIQGGEDIVIVTQPPELVFPVADLERLAGLEVQGPEDLLAFLVDTLDLEAALLMVRSLQGFVPAGSYNVDIDEEHLESSGLLDGATLHQPVWIDLAGEGAPQGFEGQCLAYPSGDLLLIAPWRGDAEGLQRRVDALMPAVSMRYDQFKATHGEHRLSTLLSRLDGLLHAGETLDHESFSRALDAAARGFSASVVAVFGPEEAASPVATNMIDPEIEGLLLSDRPFEECFEDTHVTVLKDGFTLLAGWNGGREIPYATVDSFGAMLRKLDLGSISGRREAHPDFSSLQAVFMRETRVIWQGRSMNLSNCYQFYGAARQCSDCPVDHLAASGMRSARLENHEGYIEEIHPAGAGFLVTWTKLPETSAGPMDAGSAPQGRFPGGIALYSQSGEVASWGGWFQEATCIGADQAPGQNAARLLDKLGSPAILSQLRAAQAGHFIPEPLEFTWKGTHCFSRMRGAGEGAILHTVLDSDRAGIVCGVPPLGPGTLTTAAEPGSLAEYLSTACRREGWEFDISGETGENGAPVWLSRGASTDLLSLILHQLSPMCPDRWTGLETGWLDNTPETGIFSFLPGRYHVLRFSVQGMGLPPRALLMERLSALLRGFGGWLAGLPGESVVQVGIPAALERFRETDVLVYSPMRDFMDLCREALGESTQRKVIYTGSAAEMAASQPLAQTVVCRLDHTTLHFAAALAVRIPRQPILAVSGLSLGLPFGESGVEHLRLPVDSETLFTAIRRATRG